MSRNPTALQLVVGVCALLTTACLAALPSRYATQPCSLIPHPSEPCQLTSNITTASNSTAQDGHISLLLGENNCTVRLSGCKPDLCYSFQDFGNTLTPMDPSFYRLCEGSKCTYYGNTTVQPPAYYSVFSDIAAVQGVANAYFHSYGFAFQPSSSTVTLRYSTHSCASYYAVRGRKEQQFCLTPVTVLTIIGVEFATSLPCECLDDESCEAALL